MNVTENDNVVGFDVDDTLVMWNIPIGREHEAITFNNFGVEVKLLPHYKHIELMKQFKARGHYVVVWSQGGWEWAREVIKVLGIENLVDEVKTKPKWIIDDLPPEEWMSRAYMDLDGNRVVYGHLLDEEEEEE